MSANRQHPAYPGHDAYPNGHAAPDTGYYPDPRAEFGMPRSPAHAHAQPQFPPDPQTQPGAWWQPYDDDAYLPGHAPSGAHPQARPAPHSAPRRVNHHQHQPENPVRSGQPVPAPEYWEQPAYSSGYPGSAQPGHPSPQDTHWFETHLQDAPSSKASAAPGIQPRTVAHAMGAVASLVLVAVAAVWTWQMMQRDVSGVPVVRALEGPLRVVPDNPGGRQAAFQGLSINGLAASSIPEDPDAIVLAPPAINLNSEDLERPVPVPGAEQGSPRPLAASEADTQPIAVALQRDLPDPAAPSLGFVTPNRFAVERSPRPPARGADRPVQVAAAPAGAAASSDALDDIAASVASTVARSFATSGSIDVDPASIGPGTRLVQLGAYEDAAAARAAWDELSRRFSPLLDDRGRVIEAAHSGGSVFFRLRAHGFTDERDARRFCSALVSQNVDCIPVLVR